MLEFVWPLIGVAALVYATWLLFKQLHHVSFHKLAVNLAALPAGAWLAAGIATIVTFALLAAADFVSLEHIGRRLPAPFVGAVAFVTYAISHNLGATVITGGLVRMRAYGTKGVGPAEVGLVATLCAATYVLGVLLVGGTILLLAPAMVDRVFDLLPPWLTHGATHLSPGAARLFGAGCIGLVALYFAASLAHFPPLRIGTFELVYPRPWVALQQIVLGPLQVIGAAAIVHFALPAPWNPGFPTMLGVFAVAYSLALLSHAPGGVGVFEIVFVKALKETNQAALLAALIVFRLFYFLLPLAISIVVVALFERRRVAAMLRGQDDGGVASGVDGGGEGEAEAEPTR